MKFHKFSNNFILIESLILSILFKFLLTIINLPLTVWSITIQYLKVLLFYKGSPGLQNDYFSSISSEWNAYYTLLKYYIFYQNGRGNTYMQVFALMYFYLFWP